MKRLKLEMDALTVMSFATAPVPVVRGTVRAHATPVAVCEVKTADCTLHEPECAVTGGINSCWCTEYASCGCTMGID